MNESKGLDQELGEEARQKLVASFLGSRKALVVDSSATHRSIIVKTLTELGMARNSIVSASSFENAQKQLDVLSPEIVISEFRIGQGFGLRLLGRQKVKQPIPQNRLFVLATSDSAQSSVAEAAEEDVDTYILKPFSTETFAEYFTSAIVRKIKPSPYEDMISKGREALLEDEIDKAEVLFEKAKKVSPKPTLACYYSAQVDEKQKEMVKALKEYDEGLAYNPIHYKCLSGKFDTLLRLKRQEDAYEISQIMLAHFPVSPRRLGEMLKLAVSTEHYTDAMSYYNIFKKFENKPEELISLVAAGLFVCGKQYLKNNQDVDARLAFEKAVLASGRSPIVLKRIISTLTEQNKAAEAEKILGMFSIDQRDAEIYHQLDFLVATMTQEAHEAIEKGKQLVKKKNADIEIFRKLLDLLLRTERWTAVESIAYVGIKELPDHKDYFVGIIEGAGKPDQVSKDEKPEES